MRAFPDAVLRMPPSLAAIGGKTNENNGINSLSKADDDTVASRTRVAGNTYSLFRSVASVVSSRVIQDPAG